MIAPVIAVLDAKPMSSMCDVRSLSSSRAIVSSCDRMASISVLPRSVATTASAAAKPSFRLNSIVALSSLSFASTWCRRTARFSR